MDWFEKEKAKIFGSNSSEEIFNNKFISQPLTVKMFKDLWHCPKCGGDTGTYRHPYAKVWCLKCKYVLREEGDRSIEHHIRPDNITAYNKRKIYNEGE